MTVNAGLLVRALDSGFVTMVLACVLGIAAYFFGQPMAAGLHWFWLTLMGLMALCIVALAVVQFLLARRNQDRDDQLRAILDAVPHGLFFKDTASRYQVFNAEFERAFQIDGPAFVGKSDDDLFGAALYERFVQEDRELMASGEACTYEDEMTIGGARFTFRARKQPVRDRRGKLRGIVGVVIDVTQEKALQQQLAYAHERLSIALDAALMGTWEWNLTTGELRADERARQILGIKDAVCDQSAAFARMHPDDATTLKLRLERAKGNKDVTAYEFRVIDDSGDVRWVEGFSSPNRLRAGSDFVIGVNRDITERRMSELALSEAKRTAEHMLSELEQAQANLSLALNVGELGVWRSVTRTRVRGASPDAALVDTVIQADPNFRSIFGGVDGDLRYCDLFEFVHPEDRGHSARVLLRAYRHGQGAYRDQMRICLRDGAVRTLAIRASVTTRAEGLDGAMQVTFTGIMKDITREVALTANLTAKAEEARVALNAKRQFLAMMSHEVRTPLVGILGMVDLVIETPVTDPQYSMLMRVRESSLALLAIINDILDFSKIEARKLKLEERPLPLAGLIEDVCATLAPEARRKAIDLSFNLDARLPDFIIGDSVRLQQVLTNLVGNALKFTSAGGVKVDARKGAEGALELVVEDSGIGIDAAAVESLFEPFQQADVATTRRYGGTGLGLTIVRQLVELMQGRVRCESQPGRGSRFTVTLPLKAWRPDSNPTAAASPGAEPMLRHRLAAPEPVGRGRRLLFAEDHQLNREVITLQLAKLGFECDCAEDGEQAWEMLTAQSARYALLLTDCHMPRLDGYDLAQRVRAREAERGMPRLPIVALTANALQGEAERCFALGMDDYLVKPLELRELGSALAKVLDRQATESAKPLPAYPALAELCSGDLDKVAGLVRIFVSATTIDLEAMDRAAAQGDQVRLRQLAHRLCSACHQLGEDQAVADMRALERLDVNTQGAEGSAAELAAARAHFDTARQELLAVLARAGDFIRVNGSGG